MGYLGTVKPDSLSAPQRRRHTPLAIRITLLALSALMGLAGQSCDDGGSTVTALEPGQGGIDFLIQGEYMGKVETVHPLGLQIVALGKGRFRAVYLPGGLPGEGWNGADRFEAEGALNAGGAAFSGAFTAQVSRDGEQINGQAPDGQSFSLYKTYRRSITEGEAPPAGARVLFDGTDLTAWKAGTALRDERGLLLPVSQGSGTGAVTVSAFQDFTLHLEFRLPFMPERTGQGRANSGVYLQERYELQVLDSFGNPGDTGSAATGLGGAFYGLFGPEAAPAYPPLSWQTYDIEFQAARYAADGTTLEAPPRATVRWNGVAVHTLRSLPASTGQGAPPGPGPGSLRLQAHGDPVFFRNIWILEADSAGEKPDKPSL